MVVGTEAAWPPSLWVFLMLPLLAPLRVTFLPLVQLMQAEAVHNPGQVVSWRRLQAAAGPRTVRPSPAPAGACALARRPCAGRAAWRTAASRAEKALPRRGSSAARGPSAQTAAACLLSAAPRHRSGASSRMQVSSCFPYLLVPFQQPVATAECAHPLPTDRRDSVGTDLISRLQGRFSFVRFLEKNIS